MGKPIIAITMGDPAGIGPEIVVKVLSRDWIYALCRPVVVGDPDVLASACRVVGADLRFRGVDSISEAQFAGPDVDVLCPPGLSVGHVPLGTVDPAMGRAAAVCLERAFYLAANGRVDGIVSAPMNKEAFHAAGYPYADELGYAAHLTGSQGAFILGVMGSIWTVAATEHVPFREIPDLVKKERVLRCITMLHGALEAGRSKPRLGVAALNVHAGEGGLFGREEIDEIEPAVEDARKLGVDVRGPIPADMIFVLALRGDFDGVVCMYHDQANIARKLQPKEEGATLFMGLPVAWGTTAHGTAFDIAGQGIADPGSLGAALRCVARSCQGRGTEKG